MIRKTALFILAAAMAATQACQAPEKPVPAAGEGMLSGPVPVKVAAASRERISEKILATGAIEAIRAININPETGGKVARIPVVEGQSVRPGDVLAELETESIRLQLRQAEAALSAADANARSTARNRERVDRLLAERAVSETQAENVRLADEAAQAQRTQAQAAVNLARYALDQAVMTAPWAGIVASKNVQVGDVINPMMSGFGGAGGGVVTLVDDSRIKIIVEASPIDATRLARGLTALVRSGGKELPGTVTVVNTTADPLSRKFRIEIQADNPGRALRPGSFGEVVFEVQSREDALIVPRKAVLEDAYVYVVENGRAVRKAVRLGLRNSAVIEILDGLKEGDAVVVEGNYGLIEGSPVDVRR